MYLLNNYFLKYFLDQDLRCAYEKNIEHTQYLFDTYYCPLEFKVIRAEPQRSYGTNPCQWEIQYNYQGRTRLHQSGLSSKLAFTELRRKVPENAIILAAWRCERPSSFKLLYAVQCNCKKNRLDFNEITPDNAIYITDDVLNFYLGY